MPTDPTLEPILTPYQHFLQFQKQGDLSNAQGAMYEAIRRTRRLERPTLQAALLLKLGRFYLDALGKLQSAAHAFAAGGNLLLEDSKFSAELEKAIAPLEKQEKQYQGSKDSLPDNYRPETQEDLLLAEKDPLLAVQLLVEGGNCLLELGQDQLALGMFEGALGVSALEADEVWQAKVLTNVGEVHRRLDHLSLAETFLTQAQRLFEKTGNQADTKEFLATFATLRCDQEQWEAAARLYEQAVELYREADDDQGYSRTLVRLAKLYLDQREFGKARPHLAAALELGKPSGDRSNLVFVLEGLARCYLGEGNPRAAIPYLENCFQTLRTLVEDVIRTEQGKISRIAGMQWSLNALIECYLEQLSDPDRPEDLAQLILEKIDALHGLILDVVITGTVKPHEEQESLERSESLGLDNQNVARQTAMADFTGPIEKAMDHPRREKVNPLVRLVYHLTDEHLVVVCDRPGEAPVVISRLRSRESVQKTVARLIRSLKVKLSSREVRGIRLEAPGISADNSGPLQALYQLLIQPVAALLPKQGSILVIEPHDALHLVPFGALMPKPEEYLADQYAVLISPSQETLQALRSYQPYHADLPSARVLIVGNPKMEGKIEVDGETYSQLADLPGAAAEAALLQRLFDPEKVTYLTDAAADEPSVREAARESNILHLATHGLAFTDRPMSSLLVVAGGQGYVTARTIRDWAMPADLVVLSACQTALGRLAETEGVIGLSRSLFLAGARTVVVSLWSVSDAATALLMEYFYRALLAGKTAPEAMRTAQMELKKRPEYAPPFYWAGFVVIGAEA